MTWRPDHREAVGPTPLSRSVGHDYPATVSRSEALIAIAAVSSIALALSTGFMAGATGIFCQSVSFFEPFTAHCQLVAVPLAAWIFSLSSPSRPPSPQIAAPSRDLNSARLWRISLIPVLVATAYGAWLHPTESNTVLGWLARRPAESTIWWVISIPIAEELLFRRWLFSWCRWWFAERTWPETNPMPMAVFLSALAFSIWHLQNLNSATISMVAFQMLYTFVAGIWLGTLRYQSGKLWPSVVGHMVINFLN